jgi:fructoselysine transporter
MEKSPGLNRSLSLVQATAINMIDMVGIGPFVVLGTIVSMMHGPLSIVAWLLGAFLSYMDGMVWAEMGARWPEAGGSYVFLQKLFPGKKGRMMSFLFTWQTSIQAPLVVASAAIGFSTYLQYLVNLKGIGGYLFGEFSYLLGRFGAFTDADLGPKMVSGSVVLLMILLLYRNIQSIGKLSVVLWTITGGTIIWLIAAGIPHFNAAQAFNFSASESSFSLLFSLALGQASQKAIYSYLGYYNVCHLGAEIKNPERNIPRAIFISITGITLLYLGMQTVILGVLPWEQVAGSEFVVSTYFEHIYNHTVAQFATMLVLCIALASLFSVLLGYSRVPYAAAIDGLFFPVFARIHKKHRIPHISLLAMGGLGFIFSLLFKMKDVISAIITMRILIQFVSQAIGVIAWRVRAPDDRRPFKMPLFPLPAILSIIIWLFLFLTSNVFFIAGALAVIAVGILIFSLVRFKDPPGHTTAASADITA